LLVIRAREGCRHSGRIDSDRTGVVEDRECRVIPVEEAGEERGKGGRADAPRARARTAGETSIRRGVSEGVGMSLDVRQNAMGDDGAE
jgi:hypothetical protein